MFVSSHSYQHVIDNPLFKEVEAKYNVLYAILSGEDSLCIHTKEGNALLGQTPGYFAWLYLQDGIEEERQQQLLEALVEYPFDARLPGVTGDRELIAPFVEQYSKKHGLTPTIRMELQAYHCPNVHPPAGVQGHYRIATLEDEQVLARFIVGLNEEALHSKVELEDVLPRVRAMIPTGKVFVWEVDGQVVSMVAAMHRSPRHVRINMVFTDPEHRGKQYAGAIVAAVGETFLAEGYTPMLYADKNYASSNKAYKRIGFLECGHITEYRFDEAESNITQNEAERTFD